MPEIVLPIESTFGENVSFQWKNMVRSSLSEVNKHIFSFFSWPYSFPQFSHSLFHNQVKKKAIFLEDSTSYFTLQYYNMQTFAPYLFSKTAFLRVTSNLFAKFGGLFLALIFSSDSSQGIRKCYPLLSSLTPFPQFLIVSICSLDC